MTTIRYSILGTVLAVGVGTAVSTLLAQAPAPRPEPRPESNRQFMMLDGRGSQLGVTVEDLDPATAATDKAGGAGARIADVDTDSAAEKGGLREGDIVVEYDGERVRSARQFTRLVQETPEGRRVTIAVLRDGQRQTLSVTPEGRAAAWHFNIDGERIRRDIERGMRDLPRLNELGPAFDFRGVPGMGPRGRLGVQVDDMPPQLAAYFGAESGGLLVTGVTESSAAAKAGLKAGDVITSVNGTRVHDYASLTSELRQAEGEVTLGVLRDRKEITVKATLEEARPRTQPMRYRRPA